MERSDLQWMARAALWLLVITGAVYVVFSLGRAYQHAKNGYQYTVVDEKLFDFPNAPLRLQHAHKTIGLGFFELDRSILILELPEVGKVTLYEAQHSFDKSSPRVDDVTFQGDDILWEDRHYRDHLKIDPIKPKATQAAAEQED